MHRLRGHQLCIFDLIEDESDTNEFTGPERAIGIGRDAARFHRARARLNNIINEIQIAQARRLIIIRGIGLHFHIRIPEIAPDQRDVVFRHGEVSIDLIKSVDREEDGAAGISARDDIANIDGA